MKAIELKQLLIKLHLRSVFVVPALLATAVVLSAANKPATQNKQIDQILNDAVNQKKLAGVVAMVGRGDKVVYEGAAGKQNSSNNVPISTSTIFSIASMTKPVTSAAVMQLVESGRVKLDEPVATYLPELAQLQVLESVDPSTGKAQLRAPKSPVTVRQLLTHTSGFVYEFFDSKLHSYVASGAVPSAMKGGDDYLKAPLMFDPGSQWEYGISTDWLGKLVEKVSGQNLENYFHQHIFEPLGMTDTFFNVPEEKQKRLAALSVRTADGGLQQAPAQPLTPVSFFSGGGGLYSTAGDYMKFMRMILNGGKLGKARILKSDTVALMSRNQIGELSLIPLTSLAPQFAKNPTRIPGAPDKFGLGFGINSKPVDGGRSAQSLSWSGIYSTYFWIDPARKTCAVIMTQLLPFSDDSAVSVVEQFERAVYADSGKISAHK